MAGLDGPAEGIVATFGSPRPDPVAQSARSSERSGTLRWGRTLDW